MRLLKYFFLGFTSGFILFLPIMWVMYPFQKALIAAAVVGFIYSLFVIGFMVRQLTLVEFEINAQNKDPEKGLKWYEDRILGQIHDMRYREYLKVNEIRKFRPTGLYQVLESKIEVHVSAYDITIRCSKMMKRIISDLIEIDFKDNK